MNRTITQLCARADCAKRLDPRWLATGLLRLKGGGGKGAFAKVIAAGDLNPGDQGIVIGPPGTIRSLTIGDSRVQGLTFALGEGDVRQSVIGGEERAVQAGAVQRKPLEVAVPCVLVL